MTDDETKAMRDALIFGTGFMQDGKHVPMEHVVEDNPAPYTCKHRCERDALKDRIEALDAEIKLIMEINERLLAALRKITKTAPFGQPQEIARAALGEKKDG